MNARDDDRTARTQVTLRLERELLESIDELARGEGVDRTELTRRLLTDGLAHRRVEAAIAEYATGRRSAWSAASRAGIDLYEMLDRIADAGVPYRLDPEILDRLRGGGGSPSPASASGAGSPPRATAAPEAASIAGLRERYRPSTTRILFVGESSPAGDTHFYRADSNLYRATREAFGLGLSVTRPPEGASFLAWFQELGCWLVDLADRPVNRTGPAARASAVDAGIPGLAHTLRETRPGRVLVVLRRIAPAVRAAAREAGVDEHAIDVLPFPARQWRPVYVRQLAEIVGKLLGSPSPATETQGNGSAPHARHAIAEAAAGYGATHLQDVMGDVLRGHGDAWLKASAIAHEIAELDLWRRPSDGRHPPGSQVSARARQYPQLFQTSDLGIRPRRDTGSVVDVGGRWFGTESRVDAVGRGIARRMAVGLREIYGGRLRGVYLFGSRARGDHRLDSDVDILIVLDRLERYGEELRRTSELAADLSLESGLLISRSFAPETEWLSGGRELLETARRDAVPA